MTPKVFLLIAVGLGLVACRQKEYDTHEAMDFYMITNIDPRENGRWFVFRQTKRRDGAFAAHMIYSDGKKQLYIGTRN